MHKPSAATIAPGRRPSPWNHRVRITTRVLRRRAACRGGVERLPVGGLHRADLPAGQPVAGEDDHRAEGHALTGASVQLRRLHARHRLAVHPGDEPGGRPGRRRRRHRRRHPAARPGRASAATWDTAAEQQYGAVIGAEQAAKGANDRARPDHQHRARPALGPRLRDLRRGPVPERAARRRRHPGRAGQGVMAQVKHVAVYNQETNRNTAATTRSSAPGRCRRSTCRRSRPRSSRAPRRR